MRVKPLFFFFFIAIVSILAPVSSAFAQTSIIGKTVILDPGHGGSDSEAVNGTLREAYVALDIAQKYA